MGRGRAIPFTSDLDLIFVLDQITPEIKDAKIIDSPMDIKTNFIVFNGVQIFTATSKINTDDITAVNNFITELEWLTYQEPHIAYNLTDRQDIFIENGELQGLGLQ